MAGALTSLKELFIEVRLPSDEKASHAFGYLPDTWTREGRRAVNRGACSQRE
jgi:hypothetical protein